MKFKDGLLITLIIVVVILFSKVNNLTELANNYYSQLEETNNELEIANRGNIILEARMEQIVDIATMVEKALRSSKKQDDHVDMEILNKLDYIIERVE